jgi:hypothetical protein
MVSIPQELAEILLAFPWGYGNNGDMERKPSYIIAT